MARMFPRQSISKMDAFISGTQGTLVAATCDFFILVAARSAGIALPTWFAHYLCLAIALAVVCGIIGLMLEIIYDVQRTRRADKYIAAYHAHNDRSKDYNFCKHDAQ